MQIRTCNEVSPRSGQNGHHQNQITINDGSTSLTHQSLTVEDLILHTAIFLEHKTSSQMLSE